MNASLFVEEVTHISCFLLNQRAAAYILLFFFVITPHFITGTGT